MGCGGTLYHRDNNNKRATQSELGYNSSMQTPTGLSPYEAICGMPLTVPPSYLIYIELICPTCVNNCENWPLENKVPMRSPYAFYPGVALR